MKARSFFITGLLLLFIGIAGPILIQKFASNPRNPDLAEIASCCTAIPLVGLSILFFLVGFTRFLNERAKRNVVKVIPPEQQNLL